MEKALLCWQGPRKTGEVQALEAGGPGALGDFLGMAALNESKHPKCTHQQASNPRGPDHHIPCCLRLKQSGLQADGPSVWGTREIATAESENQDPTLGSLLLLYLPKDACTRVCLSILGGLWLPSKNEVATFFGQWL